MLIVDVQACRPTFPLQITVEARSLQHFEASHLVHLTQHVLDDSNEFSAHHLRLQLSETIDDPHHANNSIGDSLGKSSSFERDGWKLDGVHQSEGLLIRLVQGDVTTPPTAQLQSHSSVLNIVYGSSQIPSTSSSSSMLASFIATQLQEIFAEEQAIIAHILTSAQSSGSAIGQPSPTSQSPSSTSRELRARVNRSLRPELAKQLTNHLTRSLKYAPTYHITISLFSPGPIPRSWEIEEAIAEYLAPLLDSASSISKFSVDTQIQLHASFSPSVQSPEYDETNDFWTLREEDLSAFINAAEWPLSPSIGTGPTLNFILYVPDQSTTPLVVKGSQASSWLVPQWGGVVILNDRVANGTDAPATLTKAAIQPALLTFSHQLLSFLGAPQTPPSLPLQLQSLTRIQAASLLLSAASTLGSLARLTKALPTIAIPETVSAAVGTTIGQLRATCSALRGGEFDQALSHARIAEAHAEHGFFEKSMVGQVYFPDEHKIAVYLPLLGPIGVPLIMSAVKEIKRLVAVWKFRRHH